MTVRVQLRRGTAAQWTSADPTLASGEMGLETDTGKFKVGDGVSAWGVLPYSSGPAGPAGPIGATGTVAAAGDGTEALPGIAFASDLNTGIYRPGADQLALSTNGTGRLFVDASGNVKVGTSSGSVAAENLTVTGFAGIGDRTAVSPFLLAGNTGGGNGVLGTFSNHALELRTNNTERLRITNAGLVGIGTSAPGSLLDISGSAGATHGIRLRAAGWDQINRIGQNDPSGRYFVLSTNYNYVTSAVDSATYGTGSLRFDAITGNFQVATGGVNTAPATRLHISSTGNVGIGTTSPDTTLSINGDGSLGSLGSAAPAITLKNVNSTNYNATAIVNRDSGGNIGCGISFRNESHGASGSSALLFWTRNVGVIRSTLTIGANGTTEFNSSASTSPAIFKINDSEVSRIDSSGRLLVGTSSDSGGALLQVNGNRIRVATAKTPASATDTGTAGEICWDASYIYVCTATNTWKRAALSTW